MKIAIMGAGCVGSVVASLLQDSSEAEVFLVAEEKRREKLEQGGVTLNGRTRFIPVLKEGVGAPDLVIMCVKNYQLEEACGQLQKWIDSGTVILPLLNSISPVSVIRDALPDQRVLYGYISKIDTLRVGDTFEYHIAGDVHFGHAQNNEKDLFIDEIARLLRKAGFCVSVDEDMVRGVWKKWMLNIGANQISALTEADYLQFGQIKEIELVLRQAMDELLLLAHRENVKLLQKDVDELIEYLTTYPYPKKTSMLQDILEKKKTEIDAISGEVLRLSEKWDQPCPVNKAMYYLIRAKEQTYLNKEVAS